MAYLLMQGRSVASERNRVKDRIGGDGASLMSLIIPENNSEETGLGRRNPHFLVPALRNNSH